MECYKNIKSCRSCGNPVLEEIISLGKINVPNFSSKRRDIKIPLELVFCKKCKLLQLKQNTNPRLLWNENYGHLSGVNNQMKRELKEIVKETEKIIKLKKGDIVIDIGCNDGTLLSFYKDVGINLFGFDPSSNTIKIAKEKLVTLNKNKFLLINNFFNKIQFLEKINKKAKIITAIAMFYDLSDPNKFLKDVYNCLDENGIFVIQQNYLGKMLEQNAIDNIVHEHLEYYSLKSLNFILDKNGFEVFDIKFNNVNGGSFRTWIRKRGSSVGGSKHLKFIESIIKKEKHLEKLETYKSFAKRASKNLNKIKDFLKNEIRKGKKIYIYGASTRGNTIISYLKLNNKLIKAATDKNPFKWGKTISGTDIPIISEDEARKEMPDYFLALPWYFKEEFIKREKDFIKKGGKFIFPLPKMEIYPRN